MAGSRGGAATLAVTAPQPHWAARTSRLTVVPQMPLARTRVWERFG
ncbi:MAG: hypothetical protein R2856_36840 [Caldilineaceae bacterium]